MPPQGGAWPIFAAVLAETTGLLSGAAGAPAAPIAQPPGDLAEYRQRIDDEIAGAPLEDSYAPMHLTPCSGGMAGPYPCQAVDLLEFLPLTGFGALAANNVWGWSDTVTGHEYALLGLDNGVAFVDVTEPTSAIYVGKLSTHAGSSNWRDVRVHQNHAYVVADGLVTHGMQVFDLTQLRNVPSPPVTFAETAHYAQVGNVHTISINEETGFAYLAGSNTCGGALHMVDLADPANPSFAGCYSDGGYVHENQCFVYHGPDTAYIGHEICLAARGGAESLDVLDVTQHDAPLRLSSFRYQPAGIASYSHQAWFTEDHRFVLLNDEFDERDHGHPTRTWIFDAQDLDALVLAGPNGYFEHATAAIDHNLYVRGNYVFQSNYRAGLRILELTDLAQGELTEAGFFDVDPGGDDATFGANWGNYPFFASGVVAVSHRSQGLFLLRPTGLCDSLPAPTDLTALANGANRIDLAWTASGETGESHRVERALSGCGGSFEQIADEIDGEAYSDLTASGQVTHGYRVRTRSPDGYCLSEPSTCVEATTTGACTAPPLFSGLVSATNSQGSACRIELDWSAATSPCGGTVHYSVYRGTSPGFVPAPGNRLAQGVPAVGFQDLTAPALVDVHYVVRAIAGANGAEENNFVRRTARASGPIGDGTFETGAEVGDPPLDSGGLFAPEHVGWEVTDLRAALPSLRSFWSTDGLGLCVMLEGTLELTAGEASTLSFWTAWDIEPAFDGGVVEISPIGSSTWTRLSAPGFYPGFITGGGALCGIFQGSAAFNGYGNFDFAPKSVSLAAWAGQTVRLRWLYRSDSLISGEGWFVDDIAISHTQVAMTCSNNGIRFADFEEGNLSEWSSTVP